MCVGKPKYMYIESMRRFFKWVLRALLAVLVLPLLLVSVLYLPFVQRWAAGEGMRRLAGHTGYGVSAERVRVYFPLRLQVDGLCLMQGTDTLASLSKVRGEVMVRPLADGVVRLRYLTLTGAVLHTDTLLRGTEVDGRVGRVQLADVRLLLASRALQLHEVAVDDADVEVSRWEVADSLESKPETPLPVSLAIHRVQGSRLSVAYTSSSGRGQVEVPSLWLEALAMDSLSGFTLRHVALREGDLRFAPSDIAPAIDLSAVRFVADSLHASEGSVGGVLSQLEFGGPYGFALQQGALAFSLSDGVVRLPHFAFRTDASRLSGHLRTVGRSGGEWLIDGDVTGAVGYADVQRLLLLFPDTQTTFLALYPKDSLSLDVAVDGPLSALRVSRCRVALPTAFEAAAEGRIVGLPDRERMKAMIEFDMATRNLDFLTALLDTATRRQLTIPHDVRVDGTLSYAPDTLHTRLAARFVGGTLAMEGSYRPSLRRYALMVRADTLDVQRIVPEKPLGRVTLQAAVGGEGFDVMGGVCSIGCSVWIDSLAWDGYTYSNAHLTAQLHERHLQVEAAYADTLLRLQLTARADYASERLRARLSLQLSEANLLGMGLADTDIRPSLQSHWMLDVDSADVYTLRARLYDIQLASPQRTVRPQPVSLRTRLAPDSLSLSLRAGDLRLAAGAHSRGLPWQWPMPIDLTSPDRARVLDGLRLTLRAGRDNPVSNYLSLAGVAVSTLQAQVYEEGTSLVAEAHAGMLELKGMSCDTAVVAATYDGRVLHARLLTDDFLWNTPSMQLSGSLGGRVVWHGAFSSDSLQGSVLLSGLRFGMPSYSLQLQSRDTLALPFVQGKLLLDAVPLYAASGQPLRLSGEVTLLGASPSLSLRLAARNVGLLRERPTPEALLYGTALLNGDVSLAGPFDALRLDGSVTLRGGSSLHYIYKDVSLATAGSLDDVVTFTDFTAFSSEVKTSWRTYSTDGFTMNLNVTVDPTVQLEVLLGASGENRGTLQGGGGLNVQFIPAVGLRLSGKYTVESGELAMNIPLLHVHSMTIVPGSTVQWSGNALNPMLNVTAEDRIRTSVTIDDTPQTVLFVAGVSLTDTMERLGLQFTLSAPENASMQNILATLSPDERNKLTVALLTTGLYLGEGGTGNLMNTALLGFLQAQLDNISRDTFRTVDVSFGIEPLPDGVSGVSTRTDYSYSVSKRFWNDRIRIVIGGSVTTSNERIEENAIIGNISIEWRIRPNGSQYLRFFYDRNYESLLEGEIRESGVGYVYRKKF